jgi:hypothetical protein
VILFAVFAFDQAAEAGAVIAVMARPDAAAAVFAVAKLAVGSSYIRTAQSRDIIRHAVAHAEYG